MHWLVSVAVLVLTYQTGEAGAKARWNPDGSFDYSGKYRRTTLIVRGVSAGNKAAK